MMKDGAKAEEAHGTVSGWDKAACMWEVEHMVREGWVMSIAWIGIGRCIG
jgi:hypothetical protein